jgi:hypothetical protein
MIRDNEEMKRKKSFLRRYQKALEKINKLEDKIRNIDERMTGIKAVRISDEAKGGSRVSIEELISDKMVLEERIKRLKARAVEIKIEVCHAIDTVEDIKLSEVLELYFIDCLSFDDIAIKINYTKRHTIGLYSKALGMIVIE